MARDAQLDPARRPQVGALIGLVFLLLFSAGLAVGQTRTPAAEHAQQVQRMFDAGKWQDVVRAVPESPHEPADLELDRGLALARLQRWREARAALEAGHAGHPRDARFLVELAGIAYVEKDNSTAKKELRQALALDSNDAYANNLLASIYFLESNLEAALKYWNRAGKPVLSDLIYDPTPRLDPLILDRAFKFSPGSVWKRDHFLKTQAELNMLDLFPHTFYDLQAQPQGTFKLVWHDTQRSSWNSGALESIVPMVRGLPYQTVYPEFSNLNDKGLNWFSMYRWDKEKRRIRSEISTPIQENPNYRFRMYLDDRNENWNVSNTLLPRTPSPAGFNMRKIAVGGAITSIASWRWRWNLGGEYSYRDFRSLRGIPAQAETFFTNGSEIAVRSTVQRSLIRFPERRLFLDGSATGEAGKFTASPLGRFGRIAGSLTASWLPKAQGEDYGMKTRLRAGRTFGQVPFDELSMLGFDRDNDLWMRGHNDLLHGQRGNAPMGRSYILSNSDIAKVVYHGPFVQVKAGPFVDTGDIADASPYFGSTKWLTDTGLQVTVRLLGSFEFVMGYGKDLRSGNNTFYSTVSR